MGKGYQRSRYACPSVLLPAHTVKVKGISKFPTECLAIDNLATDVVQYIKTTLIFP